jgi:hypothetical protein
LESVSYALQFDMHFYMHSYVEKKFILVKMGVVPLLPSHYHWSPKCRRRLALLPEQFTDPADQLNPR